MRKIQPSSLLATYNPGFVQNKIAQPRIFCTPHSREIFSEILFGLAMYQYAPSLDPSMQFINVFSVTFHAFSIRGITYALAHQAFMANICTLCTRGVHVDLSSTKGQKSPTHVRIGGKLITQRPCAQQSGGLQNKLSFPDRALAC